MNHTKTKPAEILNDCIVMLKGYGHELQKMIQESGQHADRQPQIILIMFDFAQQSFEASILMIENGINTLFMAPIARTLFESSTRLLWAVRHEYGWQRLWEYWAKQVRTWARENKLLNPGDAFIAKLVEQSEEAADHWKQVAKDGVHPMPSFDGVLKDIHDREVEFGISQTDSNIANYTYTNVYRVLCNPTHGHIDAVRKGLKRPDAFLFMTVVGDILATDALIQALCFCASGEEAVRKSVFAAKEKINFVLDKLEHLEAPDWLPD